MFSSNAVSLDIVAAINIVNNITIDDLKSMDCSTVFDLEDKVSYFMQAIRTVAAQKRAMSDQQSEINIYIAEQDQIMKEKSNINATIKAFDVLPTSEQKKLIGLGKIYHAARRVNNFAGMEKIKAMILSNLADLNLGNMFVCAHVIARAQ